MLDVSTYNLANAGDCKARTEKSMSSAYFALMEDIARERGREKEKDKFYSGQQQSSVRSEHISGICHRGSSSDKHCMHFVKVTVTSRGGRGE